MPSRDSGRCTPVGSSFRVPRQNGWIYADLWSLGACRPISWGGPRRGVWEDHMHHFRFPRLLGLFAVAMMLAFVAGEVAAAPRVNMGSRGTKTFAAPPPTATA